MLVIYRLRRNIHKINYCMIIVIRHSNWIVIHGQPYNRYAGVQLLIGKKILIF